MRLITTDEFSSHLDPFQKIAIHNLYILINTIWLYIQISTQPPIYTHTELLLRDMSFVLGLAEFNLSFPKPN